jgi:hypothetical protein
LQSQLVAGTSFPVVAGGAVQFLLLVHVIIILFLNPSLLVTFFSYHPSLPFPVTLFHFHPFLPGTLFHLHQFPHVLLFFLQLFQL